MTGTEPVEVEVAYALSEAQTVLSVSVPAGASVEQAIRRSGILERFPEIDLSSNPVGIFSRKARLQDRVSAGDRIEIYRPLRIDPKAARRRRAALARKR